MWCVYWQLIQVWRTIRWPMCHMRFQMYNIHVCKGSIVVVWVHVRNYMTQQCLFFGLLYWHWEFLCFGSINAKLGNCISCIFWQLLYLVEQSSSDFSFYVYFLFQISTCSLLLLFFSVNLHLFLLLLGVINYKPPFLV